MLDDLSAELPRNKGTHQEVRWIASFAMKYTLERATLIPRPRPEVFAFFADAKNLERITPKFLRFRILTPAPIAMRAGRLIDYELRLHGVPVRWRTLIEQFVPDEYFVDVQLSGPYKSWRHRHEFVEIAAGTEMRDRVEYELPLGPLGDLVHTFFVRSDVNRIFDFRNRAIREFFAPG
jgi:ligand-binding SRPBCC domain-containing protein